MWNYIPIRFLSCMFPHVGLEYLPIRFLSSMFLHADLEYLPLRFLSCMFPCVDLEYLPIRFLSCMFPHVDLETFVLCETFGAFITFVGFLSCVSLLMSQHVGASGELLTTQRTSIWLLSTVHSQVNCNIKI